MTGSRLCLPPHPNKLLLLKLDPSQGSFNAKPQEALAVPLTGKHTASSRHSVGWLAT